MTNKRKPLISLSMIIILIIGIFAFSCKFSFAGDKKTEKNKITFGATTKPVIKTTPQFESFKNIFADIAEKTIPTVVSITSTHIDTIVYTNPYNQFFGGNPFEEFFGMQRNNPYQNNQKKQEERRRTGFGSGVIVSSDGYILTNNHVVSDADEITVELADHREFEAEIVGTDSLSDVAVIKIKEKVSDLPVAYIGDSNKLRPGDWVMAVGNPFNLSSTVTTGIVSAKGRHTAGITMYQNFIQTDAAINPGNSGGALVNIEGELIGINSMIYTRSGGYMGIGFAIPINMARRIMEQLISDGKVSRGWLGVQIGDIDHSMKEALGLKSKKGVLVNDVFEGQPADKAGIKAGDVIISIDGIKTSDANDLKNTVASIEPGKKVKIEVIRNGHKKQLIARLDERDEKKITDMNSSVSSNDNIDETSSKNLTKKLGFKVSNITPELRDKLNLESHVKGVVIIEIDQSSKAAQKGIRKYDIIQSVKLKNKEVEIIHNINEFKNAVKGIKKDSSVMLNILRNNHSFFVAFKVK